MLNINDYVIPHIEYEFIAGLYPKDNITLLHGVQGSGKTSSTILSLNEIGIKPALVTKDFGEKNPDLKVWSYVHPVILDYTHRIHSDEKVNETYKKR